MSVRRRLIDLGHHIFRDDEEFYSCHKCGGTFRSASPYNSYGSIVYRKGNWVWSIYEDMECKDFLIKEVIE